MEKGSVLVKEVGEEGSVEGEVGAEREGEAGASSSASIMSGGRRSFSMSEVRLLRERSGGRVRQWEDRYAFRERLEPNERKRKNSRLSESSNSNLNLLSTVDQRIIRTRCRSLDSLELRTRLGFLPANQNKNVKAKPRVSFSSSSSREGKRQVGIENAPHQPKHPRHPSNSQDLLLDSVSTTFLRINGIRRAGFDGSFLFFLFFFLELFLGAAVEDCDEHVGD